MRAQCRERAHCADVRLHGTSLTKPFAGEYNPTELDVWVDRIKVWRTAGLHVEIYTKCEKFSRIALIVPATPSPARLCGLLATCVELLECI